MSDHKEPETVPQTRRAAGEGAYIPLSELHAFPGHPFKVMRDAAMEELVQSVRANGVLSRIIVRPRRAGGYEIIAGHRRSEAARLAGLTEVPAEVRRDLDDDAAVIAMIETNLKQRTRLLPSERALAYRMMRDALAHQEMCIRDRGRSIYRHDPKGKVAAAYRELTKGVLELEKQRQKHRADIAR